VAIPDPNHVILDRNAIILDKHYIAMADSSWRSNPNKMERYQIQKTVGGEIVYE
jgi:hypothetical protein